MYPLHSPAWANFSIMMECTPESGRCHSVYSVDIIIYNKHCFLLWINRLPSTESRLEKMNDCNRRGNDNGFPPSLFLNLSSLFRAGTSSPILTSSSGGSGPKSYDSKKACYSSLSLFHVRNLLHD